jgi:hypothetical protein
MSATIFAQTTANWGGSLCLDIFDNFDIRLARNSALFSSYLFWKYIFKISNNNSKTKKIVKSKLIINWLIGASFGCLLTVEVMLPFLIEFDNNYSSLNEIVFLLNLGKLIIRSNFRVSKVYISDLIWLVIFWYI